MTFDNNHDDTSSTTPGAEGAVPDATPTKPARRRATRRTAAPTDATPAPETVAAQPAETMAVRPPVVVDPTADASGSPAAPVRRSRRVIRTVGTPSVADVVASTPDIAPVAAAAAEPIEVAPTETVPVEAPAARRRAGSRRATAQRGAAATVSEPVEVAPEPAPQAEVEAPDAPRKRPTRRSRTAPVVVEPVLDETDDETEIDATEIDATGTATAPQLDVLAALAATAPPAATEARSTAPRMATTALVFQAPDPESRPRRRRAVSPAGSPEAISEAAAALRAEEQVETVATAVADESTAAPAVDEPRPERTSRRRGRRGATRGEQTVDEPAAAEPWDLNPVAAAVGVDEDAESDDDTEDIDDTSGTPRRRRRRGGRGRRSRSTGDAVETGEPTDEHGADEPSTTDEDERDDTDGDADGGAEAERDESGGSSRRRRRRRRSGRGGEQGEADAVSPVRTRTPRVPSDEVTALRGSTRLEAKRQRRREGRDAGRRRQVITESEFLARRESVERAMVVRELGGRTQIAVLEDGVLVEHYVSRQAQASMAGNVYLGRVQNVLPSMEAAFIDVGKGRNAVLYAGEVNWDAAGLDGQPRRIEQALKSGDSVLVQVTKDPMGHKGARLTSQVTLAGRYLVYVPGGGMTGISRKLPDVERNRLKKVLREIVPSSAGVIVRTAAEGASEDELRGDIVRLQGQWEAIEKKAKSASAPALLQGEPDLAIRVVRDVFNDDFTSLVVQGDEAWSTISGYVADLAPDLAGRVSRWTGQGDVFAAHRVEEQLAKGMDRKVWLPSGGSLVIDRTEAMTVVDVNTGKFTGSGGTLEETVTRNNLEAAEEIVRQLRLRDIGGIIVIDFIDMVLESNRDLVLRRLVECLGRDRTKHQVAEVTSLGLVQMTRKRVGQGLVEAFSETCEHCNGRGFIVHTEPVDRFGHPDAELPLVVLPNAPEGEPKRARRKRGAKESTGTAVAAIPVLPEAREAVKATLATIAAAAAHAHDHGHDAEAEPRQVLADAAPVGTAMVTDDAWVSAEALVPDEHVVLGEPTWPVDGPVVVVDAERATELVAEAGPVAGAEPVVEAEQLELRPVDPGVFELDGDEDGPAV